MKVTFPPTTFPKRIFWLVVGHVVIGWFVWTRSYSDSSNTWPRSAFLSSFMFSQIHLLGIWGGLGGTVLWKRLIGVLLGIGYMIFCLVLSNGPVVAGILALIIVGTVSMMAVTFVVRFIAGPIRQERSPVVAASRHQFSIRQLLILMSVIACLTAIGKLVQPLVDPAGDGSFVVLILYAIVYDVIGFIPVCFVLAMKRPVIYGICVVVVEACLAYFLGRIANPGSNTDVMMMSVTAIEATSVAVSLLVVRSCGYRLIWMPPSDPVMPPSNGEP